MYKGTWRSTLYYDHVNSGEISINVKEGWIDLKFTGNNNKNHIEHYTFNPARLLVEPDIIHISSYFSLTVEDYNNKIIRGSYNTQSPFDYGIFICQKEKNNNCCSCL